jgi:hypothetical protein
MALFHLMQAPRCRGFAAYPVPIPLHSIPFGGIQRGLTIPLDFAPVIGTAICLFLLLLVE